MEYTNLKNGEIAASRVGLGTWAIGGWVSRALTLYCGARRPEQLIPVDEVTGWTIDAADMKAIDRIVSETITVPVGLEFMAAPPRVRPPD